MEQSANHAVLRGALGELPAFSHENHQKRFYRFPLEVERLSGAVDVLPVLVSEQVLDEMDLSGGSMLEVEGQIRSFNNRAATGRRLVVSVYAQRLASCEGEPHNEVRLTGAICKEPVHRRTPLGREICDVMLAVNRAYHRADYIPCIFWGRTASWPPPAPWAICWSSPAASRAGSTSRSWRRAASDGWPMRSPP